jgi:hypothetical protein
LEVISDEGTHTTVVSPAAGLRRLSAPKHEVAASVEASSIHDLKL